MSDGWQRWAKSRRVKRNVLLLVLWVALAAGLYWLREILQPFILAALLAYVIEPLVRWLASKKIADRPVPRAAAVIGIYLGIAATVWLVAAFFVPQVYREVSRLAKEGADFVKTLDEDEIDRQVKRAESTLQRLRLPVDIVTDEVKRPSSREDLFGFPVLPIDGGPENGDVDGVAPPRVAASAGRGAVEIRPPDAGALSADTDHPVPLITINLKKVAKNTLKAATDLLAKKTAEIFGQLRAIVQGVASILFSFVIVFMLTAFILLDTERIKRFFFSIVPVEDRSTYDALIERIDRGLSGVVRGQLTICLVNGALTLVGLLLLKIKFAFILATLAAVFSLIPVFGSILSTIPIVLVALSSGFWSALLSLGWILLIHFVEANLLNPKILGDSARIHPVMIVLALVAGEHFYGIAGALLAVPVMSILLSLFRFVQTRAKVLEDEDTRPKSAAPRGLRRRYRVRSEAGG